MIVIAFGVAVTVRPSIVKLAVRVAVVLASTFAGAVTRPEVLIVAPLPPLMPQVAERFAVEPSVKVTANV
ncbi:hypothetical protein D3C71_1121280 [compost metagenome]